MGRMICVKFVLLGVTIAMAAASQQQFSSELFGLIAKEQSAANVILSPVSIQSCLALVYLGAEGSTAAELVKGLRLESSNKTEVAQHFGKLFEKASKDQSTVEDDDKVKLKIANRIYLGQDFEVAPHFNQLAEKHFGASVEKVDFAQSHSAADKINAWVEEKTEHKIQNLVASDSLDKSTASVLVNGIYFKAKWQHEFDGFATEKKDFSLSATRKTRVDMMYQKDNFQYGDLKDLKAKVVELGYRGSDISMLIILPNEVDGLAALEETLQAVDLRQISGRLSNEKVRLSLPKFKVEFDLSLQPTLEKLGIKEIFTNAADFSSLLATKQPLAISEVKHKAFIEVNEIGTEAAAATYAKAYLTSLVLNEVIYDFVADHPFVFAIKDKENVYFVGHINNP